MSEDCRTCRWCHEVNDYSNCTPSKREELGIERRCSEQNEPWEPRSCGKCEHWIDNPNILSGMKLCDNLKKDVHRDDIKDCKHFKNRIEAEKPKESVESECGKCRWEYTVNNGKNCNDNIPEKKIGDCTLHDDKWWQAKACGFCRHLDLQFLSTVVNREGELLYPCKERGTVICSEKDVDKECTHFENRPDLPLCSDCTKDPSKGTCKRTECHREKDWQAKPKGILDWCETHNCKYWDHDAITPHGGCKKHKSGNPTFKKECFEAKPKDTKICEGCISYVNRAFCKKDWNTNLHGDMCNDFVARSCESCKHEEVIEKGNRKCHANGFIICQDETWEKWEPKEQSDEKPNEHYCTECEHSYDVDMVKGKTKCRDGSVKYDITYKWVCYDFKPKAEPVEDLHAKVPYYDEMGYEKRLDDPNICCGKCLHYKEGKCINKHKNYGSIDSDSSCKYFRPIEKRTCGECKRYKDTTKYCNYLDHILGSIKCICTKFEAREKTVEVNQPITMGYFTMREVIMNYKTYENLTKKAHEYKPIELEHQNYIARGIISKMGTTTKIAEDTYQADIVLVDYEIIPKKTEAQKLIAEGIEVEQKRLKNEYEQDKKRFEMMRDHMALSLSSGIVSNNKERNKKKEENNMKKNCKECKEFNGQGKTCKCSTDGEYPQANYLSTGCSNFNPKGEVEKPMEIDVKQEIEKVEEKIEEREKLIQDIFTKREATIGIIRKNYELFFNNPNSENYKFNKDLGDFLELNKKEKKLLKKFYIWYPSSRDQLLKYKGDDNFYKSKETWNGVKDILEKMVKNMKLYRLHCLDIKLCETTDCYKALSDTEGKCKKCGKDIPKEEGIKFCQFCGEAVK